MARAKSAQTAAARPSLLALDDAVLLRVIDIMISDNSAARNGLEPWHPAHLASLACVSRCVCGRAAGRRRRSKGCKAPERHRACCPWDN
jgi:hypothetical protein